MAKIYEGKRGMVSHLVTVNDGKDTKMLPDCTSIRNHSPTGFEWGYGGSGPAQLALAILVDLIGEEKALPLYQKFKFAMIATLSRSDDWKLTEEEIRRWVDEENTEAA